MKRQKHKYTVAHGEQPSSQAFLRERRVAREYPLTVPFLRKSRMLIRGGRVDAGPAFIQVGRMVFYRRLAIEEWFATHEIGGNGARATVPMSGPPA